jgi:hypothetical protein
MNECLLRAIFWHRTSAGLVTIRVPDEVGVAPFPHSPAEARPNVAG